MSPDPSASKDSEVARETLRDPLQGKADSSADTVQCTVVVPARNEAADIQETLLAIKAQQLDEPFDIIVVDNGSIDQTKEIAASISGVRVLECTGNIAASRNLGAAATRSPFIAFLDADCLPPQDWLQRCLATLAERHSAVSVSGVLAIENPQDAPWVERRWIAGLEPSHQTGIQPLHALASFCFVIRRKAFEEVLGFDERLDTCEDSDLGHRLRERGGHLLVDCDIGIEHKGNARTLRAFFRRQMWQGGSNLENFRGHKVSLREFASLSVPFMFLTMVVLSIVLAVSGFHMTAVALMSVSLLVVVMIAEKKGAGGTLVDRFQDSLLWGTYLLARALGQIRKVSRGSR